MSDFNKPVLSDAYADVLTYLKDRDVSAITLCYADPSNIPAQSMKWNRAGSKLQEYVSAAWEDKVLSIAGGGTGATSASAARTALGLGTMATQDNNAVNITGGTITSGANVSATALTSGTIPNSRYDTTISITAGIGIGGTAGTNNSLRLYGSTSGYVAIIAAAIAGTNTVTLPAGTTDFSSTGGTNKFVKQNTAGGAFTVVTIASTDLSDTANVARLDAANAFTNSGKNSFIGDIQAKGSAFELEESDGVTRNGLFCTYKRVYGSGSDRTPTLFAETGLGLYFTVNGSATIVGSFTNDGKFGIGTTASFALDVNGDIRLNNTLRFTPSSGGIGIQVSGTDLNFYNGPGSETRLTIDNTGLVTATALAGSGSGITALNASNISSGTLDNARLASNLQYNTSQVFSWNSKTPGTVYQAASDGLVIYTAALAALTNGSFIIQVLSDSSNPPTTLRGQGGIWSDGVGGHPANYTLTIAVKKGDYWKAYVSSGSASSETLFWVPLGTAG